MILGGCLACAAANPTQQPATTDQAKAKKKDFRVGGAKLRVARPKAAPRLLDGYPTAVVDHRPLDRVLRGDFEPPDTLVVAYEEDWVDSLEQIVAAAQGQANVLLLAAPAQKGAWRFRRLAAKPHVEVLTNALDSPWVRDYGPLQTYEFSAGPLWLDFNYAWDRPLDDKVPGALSHLFNARVEAPSFELDGGAVVSNGNGLCAVTRTSMIDAGFTDPVADDLETFLASLGCHSTAILPTIPDESTGHADVVAQFLTPDLAMVAWLDPTENAAISLALDQSAETIETAAELGDYPLQIVRIPIRTSGDTFFSYVNSTRLRSRLLVPRFNEMPEELEQGAYATLETALPDVAVVAIDADVMVHLGGAIHCVTLGLGPTQTPPGMRRARTNPPPRPHGARPSRRRG